MQQKHNCLSSDIYYLGKNIVLMAHNGDYYSYDIYAIVLVDI